MGQKVVTGRKAKMIKLELNAKALGAGLKDTNALRDDLFSNAISRDGRNPVPRPRDFL